ncbi:MAG: sulfatase-like hydrolase/transferase [Acidimicrobiia bacterium]
MTNRLTRTSALITLATLGVAWPVLDILGRNAEFFVARGSGRLEIVFLVLSLAIVLPAIAALPGLIPGWLGIVISSVWTAALGTVLGYLLFRRLPLAVGVAESLAVLLGAGFALALNRSAAAQSLARLLAFSPLIVVPYFLLATPSGGIVTDQGVSIASAVEPARQPPIVMLIFDEFPLASLIDPDGNLRRDRYPNFAALADDGTWFRNAMTVQQQTEHSVPAILTGIDPDTALNPYAGQYPGSLFTALSSAYEMEVQETMTRLCPVTVCERVPDLEARGVEPLIRDVGVIAGHTLLPPWATRSLPLIDRNWGNFGGATEDFDAIEAFNDARREDPRDTIEELVEAIVEDETAGPSFFFAHELLPHNPWQFLPTGQRYLLDSERLPGSASTGWGSNAWLSAQALQRHLLQVQYVDTALGEVMRAMKDSGIYDESLLVVVADHGIALKPNIEHWRKITPDTIGEVAAVPLFIKAPTSSAAANRAGAIDDRRAHTTDIAPTVADLLGFTLPWTADGVSLFGPNPMRSETTTTGPSSSATFGVDGEEVMEVAARNATWFPTGDPFELLPPGAPDLVGTGLAELAAVNEDLTLRLDRPQAFMDVDPTADRVPARVTGRVLGLANDEESLVAVAVNGVIEAVVMSYHDRGKTGFQAMISPDRFRPGDNEVIAIAFDP